jgi:hypothetical protein
MSVSALLLESIARRKCVAAVYNRTAFRLAPHILYTRHGEIYLDAVTIARDGRAPREIRLGTFKLAGLSDLVLAPRHFEPEPSFDPNQAKYAGVTLFAVEAG